MRLSDTPPMTDQEFEQVLTYASDGTIITDLGVNDTVWAALMAIARSAPNPPPELLDAARRAFRDM